MTRLLIAGLMAAVAVPLIAAAPPMAPMNGGAMHNHVMTRAEVQGHVAKMFARVDANHDGVITKAETDAAHQTMAGRAQDHHGQNAMGKMGAMGNMGAMGGMHRDPAAAFDRIDANRDGMISRAEFVQAHAMREQKMGEMKGMSGMAGRIFEKADANHDGRVTQAEAQAEAFAHFDMMDANHDGRVTPDERKTARQMHKGR